ncbi:lipopolysaccharide assembly protein LapB [uncultured Alistipes sp.]|jgi:tetratricopeptide (TPR) repeat protein|uniref:tetratricopeptide repeat protein n=1 Tax=uncultured Alistipes sp. TaxID=538949 RepID=UPI00272C5735|nr:tetratricopeptide repeat protein [uncultured Alistipes sp.]
MKKMIRMAFAALLLLAVSAASAQKVNRTAFLSRIEKSDADIADPKKNTKAATWINRGKLFYEAAAEPTKNLFLNTDAALLKMTLGGNPSATNAAELRGQACEEWVYPYFTAYVLDNKVIAWKQTQLIVEDAPAKAIAAYCKAYELDPKSAAKVKAGLQQVSDFCSQAGDVAGSRNDYADAARSYRQAFEAQSACPAFGQPNPELLFYAGYMYTMDASENRSPETYAAGADCFNKALDLGYCDEEGNLYYFLFHCYYGQKASDPEFVIRAKDALLQGVEKFPKNERILEGLTQLYTSSEDNVGDPADLVALLDNAIASDPDNADLWFGRGRIFYALNNYDESIASFKKIVELQPDRFDGYYYLGVFYTIKGDAMNTEANQKQRSSQAAYEEDQKAVVEVYKQAVPYFEKAHELRPDDVDTLEYIKSLCFRLRDEEGMQDKYEYYNALFKKAKGLE